MQTRYVLFSCRNRVAAFFAMDNEKLIEIVREYKCLYDVSDKKYSDNQKKDQAWKEIGIKLKTNGKECKKAWALLRDGYRRAIKKRKDTKSGQASVLGKKWKYEDEMCFLLPYLKKRRTICPIPTVSEYDNDNNTNEEEESDQSPEDGQQMTDTFQSPENGQQTTGTFPSTPNLSQQDQPTAATLPTTSSPATTQNCRQPKRTKLGQTRTDETPSTVLIKYIIDSKKNIQPPDDIEQFMAGITTTLRSFPARDKAIAKAKIFEIVSRMEIYILSRPSTSNSMVSTPSPTNYSEHNNI